MNTEHPLAPLYLTPEERIDDLSHGLGLAQGRIERLERENESLRHMLAAIAWASPGHRVTLTGQDIASLPRHHDLVFVENANAGIPYTYSVSVRQTEPAAARAREAEEGEQNAHT